MERRRRSSKEKTMHHCVVTTINKPTKAIEKLHEHFGGNLIVIGDRKTPQDWQYKNINLVSVSDQMDSNFATCFNIPFNHYSRKNIGYLMAMMNNAELIYDTDDDNIPNENWILRTRSIEVNESVGLGWYNVYNLFSEENIWPRGFSLNHISWWHPLGGHCRKVSSIQQGLSDGEPDVDAIWRVLFKKQITFENDLSVYLTPQTWCPFNSQSTWWFPKAYPLMYLPVTASFRMTDIWRSFIAQRCLWEIGEGITFHSPSEVFQERNAHDWLKDFEDEVPGYLKNGLIVEILSELKLKAGEEFVCENLLTCYQSLVEENILKEKEITSVNAWVKDYEHIKRTLR